MNKAFQYINEVENIISKIKTDCADSIEQAAILFKDALVNNKKIFLFGTGHSHMLAEELFYRAGGLVQIQPVLCDDLMLHVSASESTVLERKEGLAEELYIRYDMKPDDVIVIISNSGRNGVIVDMALICKERGLKTISLTNLNHTTASPSRHKSGKRLCEITDVVLDNCGCVGDACVSVNGVDGKICATSTVAGALILNSIVARCVELCAVIGFNPPHFCSANVDGGDEVNNKLVDEYKKEFKHL